MRSNSLLLMPLPLRSLGRPGFLLCGLTAVLVACGSPEPHDDDSSTTPQATSSVLDVDGDGFETPEDCDDNNGAINPSATDLVGDDVDQNCDGLDGTDADGDGFASELSGGADCSDVDDTVNPSATEIAYDGIDQDCDSLDLTDVDGDGDDAVVAGGTDCDDADDTVYLDATEVAHDGIDQDCNGVDLLDEDGDGYDADFAGGMDCHDGDATIHPFAVEIPYDGIDQDCDSQDLVDADGDGQPALGFGGLDCDDNNPLVYDGATDTFGNNLDEDCDGADGVDIDGDTAASVASGGTDCNDLNPDVFVGALELLGDALDSDCDGVDEGTAFGFDTLRWDNPRPPRLEATDQHYVLVTATDQVDVVVSQPLNVAAALTFPLDAGSNVQVDDTILFLGLSNPLPLGQAVGVAALGPNFWGSASYVFSGSTGYLSSKRMSWNSGLEGYIQDVFKWSLVGNAYTGLAVNLVLDGDGESWSVSCGVDTLQAIHGLAADTTTHSASLTPSLALPGGVSGGMCFWDDVPDSLTGIGQAVLCDATDCVTYDFDTNNESLTPSAAQPWTGTQLVYGTYREGYHHIIDASAGGTIMGTAGDSLVLTDYWLDSLDADWRDTDGDGVDDTLYAVGVGEPVVDDGQGPRVVLSYGDPTVSMTEMVIPFSDPTRPNLVPAAAGIHVDDNRLFIGVSGVDSSGAFQDAVGWVFFGWP